MKKILIFICTFLLVQTISAKTEKPDSFIGDFIKTGKSPARFKSFGSYLQYNRIRSIHGSDSARSFYLNEIITPNVNYTDYLPLTAGSSFPLSGTLVGVGAHFSGNMGIGTTSPTYKLVVSNGGANGFEVDPVTGANSGTGISSYNRSNSTYTKMSLYASDYVFTTSAAADALTVLGSGHVGVGTTSPTYKLVVSNGGANGFEVDPVTGASSGTGISSYNRSNSTYTRMSLYASNYTFTTSAVADALTVLGSGHVGIGTTNPAYKLIVSNSEANGLEIDPVTGANNGTGILSYNRSSSTYTQMSLYASNYTFTTSAAADALTILGSGKIGIGTTSPSEKLSVDGNVYATGNISAFGFIKTKKLTVTQTEWPDYVFAKDYKLRSLSSLESFIRQNKHLPEVPSAKEVEEKGISVGDNQALLLKKIEELTLYLIHLKKENDRQQAQINTLMRNK